MACQTAPLLSPYLDDDLGDQERALVREHLGGCAECRGALESFKSLGLLLKTVARRPLPPYFLKKLQARRDAPALKTQHGSPLRPFAFAAAAAVMGFVAFHATRPGDPGQPLLADEEQVDRFQDFGSRPAATAETLLNDRPGAKPAPSPGHTNEALTQKLKQETAELGIKEIIPPHVEYVQEGPGALTREERLEQQQVYLHQLSMLKQAMGIPETQSVPVAGETSSLLAAQAPRGRGAPIEREGSQRSWSGRFGGTNEGTLTIESSKAWAGLWATFTKEPAPPVDFSRFQIIGIFLGPRPTGGYRAEIVELRPTETSLLVRYQETSPAAGVSAPEGATAPYTLRQIPRSDLPIRFERAE